MDDLMIDTETAGLPPTGALLSIGACFFDVATEQVGPTFSKTIHLATSMRDGGTVDAGTILWWMGQSEQARNAVRFDGLDVRKVLTEFAEFIGDHCPNNSVRPWGNGASFDLTIVGTAYQRAGIAVPWHFSRERCFRTVRNMYAAVTYDYEAKGDGAHNALADAQFQVEHMFKIKRAVAAARDA